MLEKDNIYIEKERVRRKEWENNNWKERRGGEVKWEHDRQIKLSGEDGERQWWREQENG